MKKLLALALLTTTAASAQTISGQPLELGLTGGYASGLSGEVFIHAPNISGPFGVKAGVAFGKASTPFNDSASFGGISYGELKRVAAAAGTPITEDGSNTVIGLDGTYSLGELAPGFDSNIYAGLRYGMFNRSTTYLNETTTFSSNAFGIGAGLMASYALSGNLSLVGDLGVDHFFNSAISNSGNNTTLNPGDAGYDDTRNLVNIPGTAFKARVGVKFRF